LSCSILFRRPGGAATGDWANESRRAAGLADTDFYRRRPSDIPHYAEREREFQHESPGESGPRDAGDRMLARVDPDGRQTD
jgi:hypothetical protein